MTLNMPLPGQGQIIFRAFNPRVSTLFGSTDYGASSSLGATVAQKASVAELQLSRHLMALRHVFDD